MQIWFSRQQHKVKAMRRLGCSCSRLGFELEIKKIKVHEQIGCAIFSAMFYVGESNLQFNRYKFSFLLHAEIMSWVKINSAWLSFDLHLNEKRELTWKIMYPESYIQKSSGAFPALQSWIARHCWRMSRQRCGPGDFVLMACGFLSLPPNFTEKQIHRGSMNPRKLLKTVTRQVYSWDLRSPWCRSEIILKKSFLIILSLALKRTISSMSEFTPKTLNAGGPLYG